jgi:dTMP kinase
VSALFIMRITLPRQSRRDSENVPWTQTYKDMIEGLTFIRSQPMVRGVMIGIAGGLLGGGLMVPLGPAFAKEVLGGGSGAFGLLMTALGIGVGIGVPLLLWLQRRLRLPTQRVFVLAVIATGAGIIAVACVSTLTPAVLIVVFVGGAAGSGYVTGFTVLQENVADELRGRIFGALYTVVRLCLLLSLTLGPFAASLLDTISKHTVNRRAHIGSVGINLPGVRLALIAGGAFTVFSGMAAQRRMRRALAMTGSGESSA